MKNQGFRIKILAFGLAILHLTANSVLAYSLENNFWRSRQKSQTQNDQPLQLAALPAGQAGLPLQNLNPHINNKIISHKTGTLRKIVQPKNLTQKQQPKVFHIQDIHRNPEAQRNIAKIIQHLIKKNDIDLIALEGAFGPLDLNPYKNFPDQTAVIKASSFLFEKGKIQGPLYSLLSLKKSSPLVVGVDDPAVYKSNVRAYQESQVSYPQVHNYLSQQRKEFETKKRETFNKSLLNWDNVVRSYRNKTISIGTYIKTLLSLTPKNSFPQNLALYHQALNLETTLNFVTVNEERTKLLENLISALPDKKRRGLMQLTLAYQEGHLSHADFYHQIEILSDQISLNLARYPHMKNYLQYIQLADSLDTEKIFFEMKDLEDTIYERLIQTEKEKRLVEQSGQLALTQKLIDFNLTKMEWEEYKRTVLRSSFFVHRKEDDGKILNIERSFEQFYIAAEKRDRAITQNLLSAIDKNKAKAIILVTGGFHTQGITSQLTGAGLTALHLVPRITKIESDSGTKALSVFTQEKTPLDKLFDGSKLSLVQEVHSPTLRQYLGSMLVAAGGRIGLSLVQMRKIPGLMVGALRNVQRIVTQDETMQLLLGDNRIIVPVKVNGDFAELPYLVKRISVRALVIGSLISLLLLATFDMNVQSVILIYGFSLVFSLLVQILADLLKTPLIPALAGLPAGQEGLPRLATVLPNRAAPNLFEPFIFSQSQNKNSTSGTNTARIETSKTLNPTELSQMEGIMWGPDQYLWGLTIVDPAQIQTFLKTNDLVIVKSIDPERSEQRNLTGYLIIKQHSRYLEPVSFGMRHDLKIKKTNMMKSLLEHAQRTLGLNGLRPFVAMVDPSHIDIMTMFEKLKFAKFDPSPYRSNSLYNLNQLLGFDKPLPDDLVLFVSPQEHVRKFIQWKKTQSENIVDWFNLSWFFKLAPHERKDLLGNKLTPGFNFARSHSAQENSEIETQAPPGIRGLLEHVSEISWVRPHLLHQQIKTGNLNGYVRQELDRIPLHAWQLGLALEKLKNDGPKTAQRKDLKVIAYIKFLTLMGPDQEYSDQFEESLKTFVGFFEETALKAIRLNNTSKVIGALFNFADQYQGRPEDLAADLGETGNPELYARWGEWDIFRHIFTEYGSRKLIDKFLSEKRKLEPDLKKAYNEATEEITIKTRRPGLSLFLLHAIHLSFSAEQVRRLAEQIVSAEGHPTFRILMETTLNLWTHVPRKPTKGSINAFQTAMVDGDLNELDAVFIHITGRKIKERQYVKFPEKTIAEFLIRLSHNGFSIFQILKLTNRVTLKKARTLKAPENEPAARSFLNLLEKHNLPPEWITPLLRLDEGLAAMSQKGFIGGVHRMVQEGYLSIDEMSDFIFFLTVIHPEILEASTESLRKLPNDKLDRFLMGYQAVHLLPAAAVNKYSLWSRIDGVVRTDSDLGIKFGRSYIGTRYPDLLDRLDPDTYTIQGLTQTLIDFLKEGMDPDPLFNNGIPYILSAKRESEGIFGDTFQKFIEFEKLAHYAAAAIDPQVPPYYLRGLIYFEMTQGKSAEKIREELVNRILPIIRILIVYSKYDDKIPYGESRWAVNADTPKESEEYVNSIRFVIGTPSYSSNHKKHWEEERDAWPVFYKQTAEIYQSLFGMDFKEELSEDYEKKYQRASKSLDGKPKIAKNLYLGARGDLHPEHNPWVRMSNGFKTLTEKLQRQSIKSQTITLKLLEVGGGPEAKRKIQIFLESLEVSIDTKPVRKAAENALAAIDEMERKLVKKTHPSAQGWPNIAAAVLVWVFFSVQGADWFDGIRVLLYATLLAVLTFTSFWVHEQGHWREVGKSWRDLRILSGGFWTGGIGIEGASGGSGIKTSLQTAFFIFFTLLLSSATPELFSTLAPIFLPALLINLIFTFSWNDWVDMLSEIFSSVPQLATPDGVPLTPTTLFMTDKTDGETQLSNQRPHPQQEQQPDPTDELLHDFFLQIHMYRIEVKRLSKAKQNEEGRATFSDLVQHLREVFFPANGDTRNLALYKAILEKPQLITKMISVVKKLYRDPLADEHTRKDLLEILGAVPDVPSSNFYLKELELLMLGGDRLVRATREESIEFITTFLGFAMPAGKDFPTPYDFLLNRIQALVSKYKNPDRFHKSNKVPPSREPLELKEQRDKNLRSVIEKLLLGYIDVLKHVTFSDATITLIQLNDPDLPESVRSKARAASGRTTVPRPAEPSPQGTKENELAQALDIITEMSVESSNFHISADRENVADAFLKVSALPGPRRRELLRNLDISLALERLFFTGAELTTETERPQRETEDETDQGKISVVRIINLLDDDGHPENKTKVGPPFQQLARAAELRLVMEKTIWGWKKGSAGDLRQQLYELFEFTSNGLNRKQRMFFGLTIEELIKDFTFVQEIMAEARQVGFTLEEAHPKSPFSKTMKSRRKDILGNPQKENFIRDLMGLIPDEFEIDFSAVGIHVALDRTSLRRLEFQGNEGFSHEVEKIMNYEIDYFSKDRASGFYFGLRPTAVNGTLKKGFLTFEIQNPGRPHFAHENAHRLFSRYFLEPALDEKLGNRFFKTNQDKELLEAVDKLEHKLLEMGAQDPDLRENYFKIFEYYMWIFFHEIHSKLSEMKFEEISVGNGFGQWFNFYFKEYDSYRDGVLPRLNKDEREIFDDSLKRELRKYIREIILTINDMQISLEDGAHPFETSWTQRSLGGWSYWLAGLVGFLNSAKPLLFSWFRDILRRRVPVGGIQSRTPGSPPAFIVSLLNRHPSPGEAMANSDQWINEIRRDHVLFHQRNQDLDLLDDDNNEWEQLPIMFAYFNLVEDQEARQLLEKFETKITNITNKLFRVEMFYEYPRRAWIYPFYLLNKVKLNQLSPEEARERLLRDIPRTSLLTNSKIQPGTERAIDEMAKATLHAYFKLSEQIGDVQKPDLIDATKSYEPVFIEDESEFEKVLEQHLAKRTNHKEPKSVKTLGGFVLYISLLTLKYLFGKIHVVRDPKGHYEFVQSEIVRNQLEDLRDRFSEKRRIVTIEMTPPVLDDLWDLQWNIEHYKDDLKYYNDLQNIGFHDGMTLTNPPNLGKIITRFIKKNRQYLKKLEDKSWAVELVSLAQDFNRFMSPTEAAQHGKPRKDNRTTIALHNKRSKRLRAEIIQAGNEPDTAELFFVKGGGRRIEDKFPWLGFFLSFLPGHLKTVDALKLAKQLQREGLIPDTLTISASWDSHKEPRDKKTGAPLLDKGLKQPEEKIEAGATVIYMQPPFLQKDFTAWMEEVHRRGLTEKAQFVSHVPYITSSRNLKMWFALTGVNWLKEPEAQELLSLWEKVEQEDLYMPGRLQRFRDDWNADFLNWIYNHPLLDGVHVAFPPRFRRAEKVLAKAGISPLERLKDDKQAEARNGFIRPFLKRMYQMQTHVNLAGVLESPSKALSPSRNQIQKRLEAIAAVFEELYPDHRDFIEGLHLDIHRVRQKDTFNQPLNLVEVGDEGYKLKINLKAFVSKKEEEEQQLEAFKETLRQNILYWSGQVKKGKDPLVSPTDILIDKEPASHKKTQMNQLYIAAWMDHNNLTEYVDNPDTEKVPVGQKPLLLVDNAARFIDLVLSLPVNIPLITELSIDDAMRIILLLDEVHNQLRKAPKKLEAFKQKQIIYYFTDLSQPVLDRALNDIRTLRVTHPKIYEKVLALGVRFAGQKVAVGEDLAKRNTEEIQAADAELTTVEHPLIYDGPKQMEQWGHPIIIDVINLYESITPNFIALHEGGLYQVSIQTAINEEFVGKIAKTKFKIKKEPGPFPEKAEEKTYADYGIDDDFIKEIVHPLPNDNIMWILQMVKRRIRSQKVLNKEITDYEANLVYYNFWTELWKYLELRRERYNPVSPENPPEWVKYNGESKLPLLQEIATRHRKNKSFPISTDSFQNLLDNLKNLEEGGVMRVIGFSEFISRLHEDSEGMRKLGAHMATPFILDFMIELARQEGYLVETKSFVDYASEGVAGTHRVKEVIIQKPYGFDKAKEINQKFRILSDLKQFDHFDATIAANELFYFHGSLSGRQLFHLANILYEGEHFKRVEETISRILFKEKSRLGRYTLLALATAWEEGTIKNSRSLQRILNIFNEEWPRLEPFDSNVIHAKLKEGRRRSVKRGLSRKSIDYVLKEKKPVPFDEWKLAGMFTQHGWDAHYKKMEKHLGPAGTRIGYTQLTETTPIFIVTLVVLWLTSYLTGQPMILGPPALLAHMAMLAMYFYHYGHGLPSRKNIGANFVFVLSAVSILLISSLQLNAGFLVLAIATSLYIPHIGVNAIAFLFERSKDKLETIDKATFEPDLDNLISRKTFGLWTKLLGRLPRWAKRFFIHLFLSYESVGLFRHEYLSLIVSLALADVQSGSALPWMAKNYRPGILSIREDLMGGGKTFVQKLEQAEAHIEKSFENERRRLRSRRLLRILAQHPGILGLTTMHFEGIAHLLVRFSMGETQDRDPYSQYKFDHDDKMAQFHPIAQARIEKETDWKEQLRIAMVYSAIANGFDLTAPEAISKAIQNLGLDESTPAHELYEQIFEKIYESRILIDDIDEYIRLLEKNKNGKILYFLDNHGEVIMDLLTVKILLNQGYSVDLVAKGELARDDITLDELKEIFSGSHPSKAVNEVAGWFGTALLRNQLNLITDGSFLLGADLRQARHQKDFQSSWYQAFTYIAKGAGTSLTILDKELDLPGLVVRMMKSGKKSKSYDFIERVTGAKIPDEKRLPENLVFVYQENKNQISSFERELQQLAREQGNKNINEDTKFAVYLGEEDAYTPVSSELFRYVVSKTFGYGKDREPVGLVRVSYPVKDEDQLHHVVQMMKYSDHVIGGAVKYPWKKSIFPLLDKHTSSSQRVGVANSFAKMGNQLVGDAYDGEAFYEAYHSFFPEDWKDSLITLVGAGDDAREILYVLGKQGVKKIHLTDTDVNRANDLVAEIADLFPEMEIIKTLPDSDEFNTHLKSSSIIINATPIGKSPKYENQLPFHNVSLFHDQQLVIDLIRHPMVTPLLKAAHAQGARIMNGVRMVHANTAHHLYQWIQGMTGKRYPQNKILLELMDFEKEHHGHADAFDILSDLTWDTGTKERHERLQIITRSYNHNVDESRKFDRRIEATIGLFRAMAVPKEIPPSFFQTLKRVSALLSRVNKRTETTYELLEFENQLEELRDTFTKHRDVILSLWGSHLKQTDMGVFVDDPIREIENSLSFIPADISKRIKSEKLNEIILEAAKIVWRDHEETNSELKFRNMTIGVHGPSLELDIDHLKINTVLTNIFNNTRNILEERTKKASHNLLKKLDIHIQPSPSHTVIEISDYAGGIDEDHLDLLEEASPDRQEVFTLKQTRREKGSGLGLAEAWWIVKMHGGKIRMDNVIRADEPNGVKITITLPQNKEDDEQDVFVVEDLPPAQSHGLDTFDQPTDLPDQLLVIVPVSNHMTGQQLKTNIEPFLNKRSRESDAILLVAESQSALFKAQAALKLDPDQRKSIIGRVDATLFDNSVQFKTDALGHYLMREKFEESDIQNAIILAQEGLEMGRVSRDSLLYKATVVFLNNGLSIMLKAHQLNSLLYRIKWIRRILIQA